MRQMLKKQMKGVPDEEIEKLVQLVSKNPELFQQIAEKAQGKMKQGKDQMSAIMEAAQDHKEELEKLIKE